MILFCVCLAIFQILQNDTLVSTSFLSIADVHAGSQLSGLAVTQPSLSHTCEQGTGLYKCSVQRAGLDLHQVDLMVSGRIGGKAARSVSLFILGAVTILKP